MSTKQSKLETFKQQSRHLRGSIADALQNEANGFAETEKQLLKFHGTYQQDDRDQRTGDRRAKKSVSFMVRSRIPGGILTADQYLAHDELAGRYANGTLRITTRQGLQLHGVLKGDLKPTIADINQTLITTLGACGDVVRNVMCCPAPNHSRVAQQVAAITDAVAALTSPRTRAYHEIWLDEEKVVNGAQAAATSEPLYGDAYLPRKFKLAIAYAGDNCVDVYAQDLGLIAISHGDTLLGFNVLAGGGLGMTHKKPETFPRLGDPIGFATPDQVEAVVAAIVGIHRDFGDRANRKHARLKYIIHDRGLEWFKQELSERLDFELAPFAPQPPFDLDLHLGWQEQGDGHWYLGISVENGRIQDTAAAQLRSGLREVISRFRPNVHLTPNHDILLTNLHIADRPAIDALLAQYGIAQANELSNVQLYAMACPALPTCGLALAESERVMPTVIDELETAVAGIGLAHEKFTVRMTGCPNGCARPYVADLAFVGRSADKYLVLVGGNQNGTQLNQPFADLVPLDELVSSVLPLFVLFRDTRYPNEPFGDFCNRVGVEKLQEFAAAYPQEGVYA
ncbi:MAG: NADPH-dependent assimilatory sulfite reductase hemoprotein subunit [Caldilineaceae bacterium]|nr:NADPH-dependent assimilatory sulfite reductase hemoprotein subunit [Caldilineaceae bacterium]